MRTWDQTEEPHSEQFAMDKEKLAILTFSIFNDCKRIFLAWGLGYILMFTVDAKLLTLSFFATDSSYFQKPIP